MRQSPIIGVKEAADYLNVHPSTIYRMLKCGELKAIKIRSDWAFTYEQLDAWLAAQWEKTK